MEVPLERGVPDEHDYVFYGEGDEIVNFNSIIAWSNGWRHPCEDQDKTSQVVLEKGC